MKVTKSDDGLVEFDNGLKLSSDFEPDCCTQNYLDFEQLHIGREFKDMTPKEFLKAIAIKEDGFSIKDTSDVPAWVQARSEQNGYYSTGVDLIAKLGNEEVRTGKPGTYGYSEQFSGVISDEY